MTKTAKTYKHTLLTVAQARKHGHAVCGDYVAEDRSPEAVTFLVLDGIGSGAKANVSAQMFASRLLHLLRNGFTTREACSRLVETMHAARTQDVLFAAFTLVRVLNDGSASIISYEMPAPLFIESGMASVAAQRFFTLSGEVVGESVFHLGEGNGIMIVSDGITQAGLGLGKLREGWTLDGARDFINKKLSSAIRTEALHRYLLEESLRLNEGVHADDATVAVFTCRRGKTVRIMTGPPSDPSDDHRAVSDFLAAEGTKVVCGSTTSDIVAAQSGRGIRAGEGGTPFEPPEHFIEGVELVTEGALTLNQLYNIINEPSSALDTTSPVSKLLLLLRGADRIYFDVGLAKNPGHKGMIFRQLGLLPRPVIVPLLAEKLRSAGKLVIISQR
jgi:hypothetical protein